MTHLTHVYFTFLILLGFNACSPPPITPVGNAKPSRDAHLALGNPSQALKDPAKPDNYLMEKETYALSYNSAKGQANWVAWHLSKAWKGGAPRQDNFRIDQDLPAGFSRVSSGDYTNSGFDRGHLCPSDDRDSTVGDNSSTFLMTNIIPQSPNLNRISWLAFENYCRNLMDGNQELYIYAGGYGKGGEGTSGVKEVLNGKVQVPSHCWKIAVILPVGTNDLARVSEQTRVIAIDMPNTQTVNQQSWGDYRVSVDFLEMVTGYDFLSNVPEAVQMVLEAKTDSGPTQ